MLTLDLLEKNKKAKIVEIDIDKIPLKLIEMGCLPGNEVVLVELAILGGPMYFVMNSCHLAIRKETAQKIIVELI